jgi:cell division protein FtsB
MEYILAAGTGLFLVLFVFSTHIGARRRKRIHDTEKQLDEHRRRIHELEARLDEKSRQVEQLGNQAEQARGEAKKAKKKAHNLEQQGRESRPPEDAGLDRAQAEVLQEARHQASQAKEKASQSQEECGRLREQAERFKQELQEAKSALSSRQDADIKTQKDSTGQLKRLQKENFELNRKLQSAKRKARTDSQVYRVTNSKLDLAMDKIQMLEKIAKSSDGSTTARQAPKTPPPG